MCDWLLFWEFQNMYVLLFIQLRVFFEVHSGQVLSRILSLLIFSCLEWEQSIIVYVIFSHYVIVLLQFLSYFMFIAT